MSEREDIIVRLRKAYAFLRDDGRFVTANIVLVATHEIHAFRKGIADIIAICEQDARDQDHNAGTTGFGPGSKAYAEGRGTACRGIAARLRTLLDAPSP